MASKYSLSPAMGLAPRSIIAIDITSISGENSIILMVYNENQRPDEFTYSDTADADSCLQPSTYRREITEPVSVVIQIENEDQYSVILLNCFPTSVTVSGCIKIRNFYNGMLVNLAVEEQPEVIIWPVVFLIYLFVFIVFVIINSKSRFRGTQFIRYIDILLEMIVFIKIISSLLQTGIILYTLYYNSVNSAIVYLNSFLYRLVDVALLMVMFLLACGWQITHQLPTKKEIQFGASILAGLLILAGVSSFCDSQIDGLCNGFSVVNYIFQSIVIITILICININISTTSAMLQSSQYNPSTIRIYISKASFTGLLWCFLVYILRPTFVAIIGSTVLSWKYQNLITAVDEAIILYIFIRLRIIMHPYTYKGYYRVNREIISHMNQAHVEDDTMPFDQATIRMRNRPFMPINRDSNLESDNVTWLE